MFTDTAFVEALALIDTQLLPALAPLGACTGLPRGKTVELGMGIRAQ